MNPILLSVIIGIVAGTLDAVPMMIKKLPKVEILSAFLQYVVVSVVVVNIDLPNVVWWIEGGLISLIMALPIVVLVGHKDRKVVPIILLNSVVLGTLIAIAGRYLT